MYWIRWLFGTIFLKIFINPVLFLFQIFFQKNLFLRLFSIKILLLLSSMTLFYLWNHFTHHHLIVCSSLEIVVASFVSIRCVIHVVVMQSVTLCLSNPYHAQKNKVCFASSILCICKSLSMSFTKFAIYVESIRSTLSGKNHWLVFSTVRWNRIFLQNSVGVKDYQKSYKDSNTWR